MAHLTDHAESNFGKGKETDDLIRLDPPFNVKQGEGFKKLIDSLSDASVSKSYNQSEPENNVDKYNSIEGFKEHDNKTDYSEIDFAFITQMARRMNKNKGKYPKNNWKKPLDVNKLKQAMFRHVIAVMQDEFSDDGREMGHLEAIALNAQMINYQLKYLK